MHTPTVVASIREDAAVENSGLGFLHIQAATVDSLILIDRSTIHENRASTDSHSAAVCNRPIVVIALVTVHPSAFSRGSNLVAVDRASTRHDRATHHKQPASSALSHVAVDLAVVK